MRKTQILLLIVLLCNSSFLVTSCNSNKEQIPALIVGNKAPVAGDEATLIKTTYDKAVDALKKDPDDLKQFITLATAYISEGRITGNNSYYSNAAIQMLDKVTDKTTGNADLVFQSVSLRSAILLNMHQFKDALDYAQKGVAMNSYNSGIYGALVDANVEMGNYDEAVKDCDRMINIRPDLRSYSRASYLRQIFGQNAGAIAAMKMAVEAGLPGQESTEWARTNLADLYLNTGNIDSASLLYRTSLVYRPDYPFALVGLAQVEKTRKNYDGALEYVKKAIRIRSEAAFVSLLADIYDLKDDVAKAKETRSDVVGLLVQGEKDEPKDALVKHNVSRELATAYLAAGEPDKALPYAQTDLNMRPNNIDANELIAWIYYKQHDYANAKIHADKMLATKTQNATYLYKAGLIYCSAGELGNGRDLMQQALTINPNLNQGLANDNKVFVTAAR